MKTTQSCSRRAREHELPCQILINDGSKELKLVDLEKTKKAEKTKKVSKTKRAPKTKKKSKASVVHLIKVAALQRRRAT